MDQSFAVIVAGVFAGNALFAWFLWGLRAANKENPADVPWSAFGAILIPLVAATLIAYVSFG